MEVAYYLIHSMERADARETYVTVSRARADRGRELCERRVACWRQTARVSGRSDLGWTGASDTKNDARRALSLHLRSREAVERILREAVPDTVVLRASIVIGARSRSFRFLVRLIERMPVLALPAWHTHRTRPIDARDVIDMLARLRGRALSSRDAHWMWADPRSSATAR